MQGSIERIRRDKGVTQIEASKLAGISVAIWNRAEKGKSVTLDSFEKMVNAIPELGSVTLNELIQKKRGIENGSN